MWEQLQKADLKTEGKRRIVRVVSESGKVILMQEQIISWDAFLCPIEI